MALVHHLSQECVKSELDLFTVPYTQTSIDKSLYVEIPPLSALSDTAPLEFYIAGNGEDYLDLNNTLLRLACKITKADNTDLDVNSPVSIINYPIATIFSQVDVSLGERLISQSSSTYPYRSLIEVLLNYGKETLESQFSAGMYFKDTAGNMDVGDPAGANEGLRQRCVYTRRSHVFELLGPLHSDIFFQEKLMLNGIDVKIKMIRASDRFCLMAGDANQYKLHLLEASLYVKKVKVSPDVKIGHAQALMTSNAKYPIERVAVKVYSIPRGLRVSNQENMFLGQLPKFVVIGLTDNDAFSGDYVKNPFNFKHFDANFIALYVDGEQIPSKPFQPNYANTHNSVREYYSLIQATGRHLKDKPLIIDRSDYSRGYTLYAFDLTPDQEAGDHFSLVKTGNMRLEMRFSVPLPDTVNLIIYAVFENVIEVSQQRAVLFDY